MHFSSIIAPFWKFFQADGGSLGHLRSEQKSAKGTHFTYNYIIISKTRWTLPYKPIHHLQRWTPNHSQHCSSQASPNPFNFNMRSVSKPARSNATPPHPWHIHGTDIYIYNIYIYIFFFLTYINGWFFGTCVAKNTPSWILCDMFFF